MIGRKNTNDSLEKRQSARLDLVAKKITPQERVNQYPGKFHADDNLLFCSTCNGVVDPHRKSVLDNHLSAVSHIKRMNMNPLGSERNKKNTC